MSKIYAGIGSRETPPAILEKMIKIGYYLAQQGWTLRSGGAPGADQAFERGAIMGSGKMEIYLPWDGFNGKYERVEGYIDATSLPNYHEARSVAEQYHPAWDHCNSTARRFHTRNVYQIGGRELAVASDAVICWTKHGKGGGGTGQAIRIAKSLEIPVFDLAVCSDQEVLNFIHSKEVTR